jgi:hypothetical protein
VLENPWMRGQRCGYRLWYHSEAVRTTMDMKPKFRCFY